MQNYNGSFKSPVINATDPRSEKPGSRSVPPLIELPRLDRGWIIANHKLVSFHAAFLTSSAQHFSARGIEIRCHPADVSQR